MRIDGSSIPFHLARAYGIQQPARPAPVQEVPAEVRAQAAASPARQLVAARVPGSIDFSTEQPRPTADAIPFYRAPWEKNAAAVAVQLGRGVDLTG